MKKQYIIPALVTINVETQAPMLFGSGTEETKNGGGSKGDFNSGSMSQLSNEGEITNGSVWDEEE